MTTIAPTQNPAAAQAQDAGATSRLGLANNFETFLTLLTAQLRNQDPLSPMDTKDFTNQLVQFTGVEQQLRTNDLLSSLTEVSKTSAGATAVAYLGKDAVAATDLAGLPSGGNATWTYEMPREAANMTIRVLDQTGRVVATAEGPKAAGTRTFEWDGKTMSGAAAAPGTYRLQIDATGSDGRVIGATISQRGPITGVDLSGAQALVTIGGANVPLATVRSIGLASK
jgi:flagellar basal-body rod modification protein FlgD